MSNWPARRRPRNRLLKSNKPVNGPPGAARASTRFVTAGSSTSGGAWCGLMRASITSGPRQPQCFCSMNAPTPSTSAAGFERVNVTQRKLFSDRAANSLSSTSTISGKRVESDRRAERLAEARAIGRRSPSRGERRRLRPPARPAGTTRGSRKPSGRRRPAGTAVGSVAPRRAGRGDHHLRALVQPACPSSRACRSSSASGSAGRVASRPARAGAGRTPGCRGCRGPGRPRSATMSRYLASDSCPWPRIALACVSSSCGRARGGVRHVALAADRQQQRMDAGGIDGVDRVDAGEHRRDDRPGQLVDDCAERRVFLRRPADDGERPDRAVAVIDALDVQHREVVRQAVVAEVIAERPFGQLRVGIDRAGDAEVGVGGDRQAVRAGATSRTRRPPSAPANASSGSPSGSGITAASVMRRRAADEDVHAQRLAAPDGRRVMDADAAVDLVVQPDLAVGLVLVARELHAVHAEVRLPPAGPVGVFGVDLRQRDERARRRAASTRAAAAGETVVWCARTGPRRTNFGRSVPQRARARRGSATGCSQNAAGIDLQLDQLPDGVERVAEQEPGPLERAEQVADHREAAALDAREQNGRPAGLVDAALDLGRFQVGVDLRVDADELPGPLQVGDASRRLR